MDIFDTASYDSLKKYIDVNTCGAVYPQSIAEAKQSGDVFCFEDSVIFWHRIGFAFAFGGCDDRFLEQVYREFLSGSEPERRFILFTAKPRVEEFFRQKEQLKFGKRYFFENPSEQAGEAPQIPEQYSVCEFGKDQFETVQGRVIPRLFWKDYEQFSEHGKGFCIMHGGKAVSWAFSAAVSDDEIDIGIETSPEHQHKGLAMIAAREMIGCCLTQHKRPVWACDSENKASQQLALKAGFVKCAECTTIRSDRL